MSGRETGVLACRAMALYAVLKGILQVNLAVSVVWAFMESGSIGTRTLILFFQPVICLAFAALLWWKAAAIGSRMIPESASVPSVTRETEQVLMSVAFAVVGLPLLLWGAGALLEGIAIAARLKAAGAGHLSEIAIRKMIIGAVQFAAGVWLLLGSRGIAHLVVRARGGLAALRAAGTKAKDDDERRHG